MCTEQICTSAFQHFLDLGRWGNAPITDPKDEDEEEERMQSSSCYFSSIKVFFFIAVLEKKKKPCSTQD